jgi:hypothetical protein
MTPQELREGAPIGHSMSSHHVHGWCSHCADRTPADEVVAWRVWAQARLLAGDLEHLEPQLGHGGDA